MIDKRDEADEPRNELPEEPSDSQLSEDQALADETSTEGDSADEQIEAIGDIGAADNTREVASELNIGPIDVAESVVEFSPTGAADASGPPATLPLFDESGNRPTDFGALMPALRRWEEAAGLVPGDPQFTPQSTDKPREALLQINRGPHEPVVWLDRETMTPVHYTPPDNSPWNLPLPESRVEPPRGKSKMRSPLVVKLDRSPEHFRDAFRASGERFVQMMKAISNEGIREYHYVQWTEERAANYGRY
ncbi:MAG: hypothetical protein AB7O59_23745 [Pirellulales bacterium]